MNKARFQFSNVVIVDDDQIGVIVKTWATKNTFEYEVYVRSYGGIKDYTESDIKHYVFNKYLHEDEYGSY
jgi:hypothetical protein